MSESPAAQLIQMICSLQTQIDDIAKLVSELENAHRAAYVKALREDITTKSTKREIEEWQALMENTIAELFTPGTVIAYTDTLSEKRYYVVDRPGLNSQLNCYRVTNPPTRRKRANEHIYIAEALHIITTAQIEDPILRRIAEKLVARVRMKDW